MVSFDRRLVSVLVAGLLLAGGCSTASVRVMPGEDGTNRVVVRDVEKYSAEKEAFEAAKAYCEDRGSEAVFLSDDVEYTGTMDEETRESIRRSSDSATMLAGVIRATEVKDAAYIFEGGAAVGRSATSGKDYKAEVRFVCGTR